VQIRERRRGAGRAIGGCEPAPLRMYSLPTGPKYHPTLRSSAEEKVVRLKHNLVLNLFLQQGPFWEAVQNVRSEWGITARRVLPSKGDRGTYRPIEQEPPDKWTKGRLEFNDRWDDALRSLRDRFVPNRLRRGLGHKFFGACVMCDPPEDSLLEFSKFGAVYPSVFWPA